MDSEVKLELLGDSCVCPGDVCNECKLDAEQNPNDAQIASPIRLEGAGLQHADHAERSSERNKKESHTRQADAEQQLAEREKEGCGGGDNKRCVKRIHKLKRNHHHLRERCPKIKQTSSRVVLPRFGLRSLGHIQD